MDADNIQNITVILPDGSKKQLIILDQVTVKTPAENKLDLWEWLRGHGGGNRSGVSGESTHFTALGVVTAVGLPEHNHSCSSHSILPEELFVGPVSGDSQIE